VNCWGGDAGSAVQNGMKASASARPRPLPRSRPQSRLGPGSEWSPATSKFVSATTVDLTAAAEQSTDLVQNGTGRLPAQRALHKRAPPATAPMCTRRLNLDAANPNSEHSPGAGRGRGQGRAHAHGSPAQLTAVAVQSTDQVQNSTGRLPAQARASHKRAPPATAPMRTRCLNLNLDAANPNSEHSPIGAGRGRGQGRAQESPAQLGRPGRLISLARLPSPRPGDNPTCPPAKAGTGPGAGTALSVSPVSAARPAFLRRFSGLPDGPVYLRRIF
jgi:hypothetical protein